MNSSVVAGSGFQPGSTTLVLPLFTTWLGFGWYTSWHFLMGHRFLTEGKVAGSCFTPAEAVSKEWGYYWEKPKRISDSLLCFRGEQCAIIVHWTPTDHRVEYFKTSLDTSLAENRASQVHGRLENFTTHLTFTFGYYGPARYHLRFQPEFWATPVDASPLPQFTREPKYVMTPILLGGIQTGIIHYMRDRFDM